MVKNFALSLLLHSRSPVVSLLPPCLHDKWIHVKAYVLSVFLSSFFDVTAPFLVGQNTKIGLSCECCCRKPKSRRSKVWAYAKSFCPFGLGIPYTNFSSRQGRNSSPNCPNLKWRIPLEIKSNLEDGSWTTAIVTADPICDVFYIRDSRRDEKKSNSWPTPFHARDYDF